MKPYDKTKGEDNPARPGDGEPESQKQPWWNRMGLILGPTAIVITTIVGLWVTNVSNSNRALIEAQYETIRVQLNNIKERQDRIENRVIFLEQNRTSRDNND